MPKGRRDVLLRVANVNPDSVITHTDRVLYSAIGVFILLYFVYATVGGAAFIDASSNYQQPWYRWLVGPLVAAGVVAFDRAVVGRVSISYDKLESTDPREFLRKPTVGLYAGRLGLALLFAVIVTEPLMLARYQGEIDARLNEVHNQQLSRIDTSGVIGTWTTRLEGLKRETAADDSAVRDLTDRAAQKRRDARLLYQQAVDDAAGEGVTRSTGCPAGGYCSQLVQRSRGLDVEAVQLDRQAGDLLAPQRAARDARAAEQAQLTRQIGEQRQANSRAVRDDSGFGARTAAMWHLVTTDFWGVGVFYLGITLLLVSLDCAAVGLKLVSRGNAYERNEARIARRREHEAALVHEREIHDARSYGAAMAKVVSDGIEAAVNDERVARESAERASAVLRTSVVVPDEVRRLTHHGRHHRPIDGELVTGRHRRTPAIVTGEKPAIFQGEKSAIFTGDEMRALGAPEGLDRHGEHGAVTDRG